MPWRRLDEQLSWTAASTAVVAHLRQVLGFEMVAITRKRHDDMVVLEVRDDAYGLTVGTVVPWADTFCDRAADGRAPRISPDIREVPAYLEAAELLAIPAGAYLSMPLRGEGGVLLGSLCAASPRVHGPELHAHAPMLEVYADLLGALLSAGLQLQREVRRSEQAELIALDDALTGLGNRRMWDRRVAAEERRCAAYGLRAGVLALHVDGLTELNEQSGHAAGDLLLREVAAALREAVGSDDVVARVGGGEFAVLLPEADQDRLDEVVAAVHVALEARAASASIGTALRDHRGCAPAWREADARMQVDRAVPRRRPGTGVGEVGQVSRHDDDEVLLRELLDLARRQVGTSIAFIGQWQGPNRIMRGVSSAVPIGLGRGAVTPLDETYCQRIVDGRLPAVIPDTALDPVAAALPATRAHSIGCYVGVPVVLSDGQLYGTLCCLSRTADPSLSERDVVVLEAIAESMARVLEAEQSARAARGALVARLDRVVSGRATCMVFQPVVSLLDGHLVGAEALARFTSDPPRPTGDWFSDAERAGLTCDLELSTARAALAAAAELPGFLALNFSATTICSPGFLPVLDGVDPARLVVEISEHEQIDDYGPVLAALAPLRARGLRLAVDDAGAGFASLRHVVQLSPEIIKLDISLVRGIEDDPTKQALAAALTTFARQTGAQVIAEGVEREEQRVVLSTAGVSLMQGWLSGAGVGPTEFVSRWGARRAVPAPRPATSAAGPGVRRLRG